MPEYGGLATPPGAQFEGLIMAVSHHNISAQNAVLTWVDQEDSVEHD